jgi:hypothetical protein
LSTIWSSMFMPLTTRSRAPSFWSFDQPSPQSSASLRAVKMSDGMPRDAAAERTWRPSFPLEREIDDHGVDPPLGENPDGFRRGAQGSA